MKKLRKISCLVLACLMLLTACGGDSGTEEEVQAPVVTTGEESAMEREVNPPEPVDRDDVIFVQINEPRSLDPLDGENAQDWMFPRQILETLIRDAPGDPTTQLPALAESWEFSEDGLTLYLTIPEGIQFSNGYPCDVENIVWSLNRSFEAPATDAYTGMIDNAEVVDDQTVAINLLYPYEPITKILTNVTMGIQSRQYYEECQENGTSYGRTIIGTGAYKLDSWTNGQELVLVANETYHGEPANIPTVICTIMADQTSAGIAMEMNEIDVFFGVSTVDLNRFRTNPDLQVLSARSFTFYSVWFNTTRAPFDNKDVRVALSYAIDRQAVIDGGANGVGWTIECPMPSGIFGYQEEFEHNPYDPEMAKQLLAEAGYPDGFSCTLKCTTEDYVQMPAQIIQEQLRQVGIDCELVPMERGTYLEEVQVNSDFDIIFAGSGALYADADSITYKCLHSSAKGQGGNWSLYDNPEMDALLDAARQEIDSDTRYDLYTQVSELCKEDCPIIPVMQSTNTLTAWKDIQGVYGHPASAFLFQDWYWLTE